jgi:6-phosphogluconolactonase
MFQKALMLGLVFAAIAAGVGCGSTSSHYVYVTIPAANQLAAFREDPNSGVLTELAGSPYSVGDGVHSVVIHPSGLYMYAVNPGIAANNENDISLFDIASDGGLTEVFPRTSLGSTVTLPQLLVMDPAGAYLYCMNAGSNNISIFSIDSMSGALSQVSNSPINIGLTPLNMQLTPNGNFLYVSAAGTQTTGDIVGYSVSAGQLTEIGVTPSDGLNPEGLAIDPAGSYLYAGNNAASSSSIAIFSIGSNGALTSVPGSPLNDSGYSSPIWMTFDPNGQFLYVANEASNNITAYSINSTTGLPAALTSSVETNAFATETGPAFISIDPNGNYLFVGNQQPPAGIQAFSISSGSLTVIKDYGIGNSVSSIAVLK